MGYYTRVTGEIRFEPPIPWGAVKDDEYLKDWSESSKCIRLHVEEATVETDEGTLTKRSVVGIVPISEDRFKAYDIEAEVQEVVSRYCSPGGRECHGRLEGEGEESGDLWRLYVRSAANGREYEVVKDAPRIVWPDGEIQDGRS
jgi:hypothetical protein